MWLEKNLNTKYVNKYLQYITLRGNSTGLVRPWVCSPMITSSSPLKATNWSRQNLTIIVVHVLVECCMSLGISRGACIYGTLTWTPKVMKKNISTIHYRKCTRNLPYKIMSQLGQFNVYERQWLQEKKKNFFVSLRVLNS